MKKIASSFVLSTLVTLSIPLHAFSYDVARKVAIASAVLGVAATGVGLVRYRTALQRKRTQFIDNFFIAPLEHPCTPYGLRLAFDEMKRALSVEERLYVIERCVAQADGMRNSMQESLEGLRMISRASDIAMHSFTPQDIKRNGWISPLQLHMQTLLHFYASGHDERAYKNNLSQVRVAIAQAQQEESSIAHCIQYGAEDAYVHARSIVSSIFT